MDVVSVILAAVLGGGVISAIAAYRKSGPESEALTVATMKDVIEELRIEIARLAVENEKLKNEVKVMKAALFRQTPGPPSDE